MAEVYVRVEERRGRRGETSPEERGNEIGKVAIAHGSVEFREATPIDLADESKESLYGRKTCLAPRHVDALRGFHLILCSPVNNKQRGGGGGGMLPDFFFCSLFPVQQTTSRIGYSVK